MISKQLDDWVQDKAITYRWKPDLYDRIKLHLAILERDLNSYKHLRALKALQMVGFID